MARTGPAPLRVRGTPTTVRSPARTQATSPHAPQTHPPPKAARGLPRPTLLHPCCHRGAFATARAQAPHPPQPGSARETRTRLLRPPAAVAPPAPSLTTCPKRPPLPPLGSASYLKARPHPLLWPSSDSAAAARCGTVTRAVGGARAGGTSRPAPGSLSGRKRPGRAEGGAWRTGAGKNCGVWGRLCFTGISLLRHFLADRGEVTSEH